MGMYKLLVGLHVGPDYSCEPEEVEVPAARGKGTKTEQRWPSKVFQPGSFVESDLDLVKFGGPGKFAYAGASPRDSRRMGDHSGNENVLGNPTEFQDPTSFPGGQVCTGHQRATSFVPTPDVEAPLGEPAGRGRNSEPITDQATLDALKRIHDEAMEKGQAKREEKSGESGKAQRVREQSSGDSPSTAFKETKEEFEQRQKAADEHRAKQSGQSAGREQGQPQTPSQSHGHTPSPAQSSAKHETKTEQKVEEKGGKGRK